MENCQLDAERPVPRNHTPRTTGDHSGPTESDWDSTDCFPRTSSNEPSRRGGKRKSARERRLFRVPRGRVGARALFCTGIAEKTVFRVDAIRWSDSTDCFFSTRSNDPSGRGVDRGGLKALIKTNKTCVELLKSIYWTVETMYWTKPVFRY